MNMENSGVIDTTPRDRLAERLFAALREDAAVRAIWLGGSLGRGTADEISDIDFYLAVEDAEFERFFGEVPDKVNALQPLIHYTDFAFRRQSPTERVWFFYFDGWPVHWRLDFHVHTASSARGADPDQRRELVYGEWKVLHDPEGLLAPLPQLDAPDRSDFAAHAQEKVDNLAWNFALAATYVKRDDFWQASSYLQAIHDRIFYLMAIEADPAMTHDVYPRRFAKVCDPGEMAELQAARFGGDRAAMTGAGLALLGLYERVAQRLCAQTGGRFPAVYAASVRRTYEGMASAYAG
jgi:predicted nucleotidyltransferase